MNAPPPAASSAAPPAAPPAEPPVAPPAAPPAKARPDDACCATLRDGRPCRYRAKDGGVCGVHARCAGRAPAQCSICLDDIRRSVRTLPCGHAFHARCITRWFRRGTLSCPLCRQDCMSELGAAHPLVSDRLRLFFVLAPRPAEVSFIAYVAGLLGSRLLQLDDRDHELLTELTYHSLSEQHMLEMLRRLEM